LANKPDNQDAIPGNDIRINKLESTVSNINLEHNEDKTDNLTIPKLVGSGLESVGSKYELDMANMASSASDPLDPKGLLNPTGENNCFLNCTIQVLD